MFVSTGFCKGQYFTVAVKQSNHEVILLVMIQGTNLLSSNKTLWAKNHICCIKDMKSVHLSLLGCNLRHTAVVMDLTLTLTTFKYTLLILLTSVTLGRIHLIT